MAAKHNVRLVDIDTGYHIADCDKGDYDTALENLAAMLGCEGSLCSQASGGPVLQFGEPRPHGGWVDPERDGWVVVGDGCGHDAIYLDKEPMATAFLGRALPMRAQAVLRDGQLFHMSIKEQS